ncbi:MarR family winged helix-turn-helix transcriptional regulator [Nocardia sp. CA-120079]|uniref:MarR family winged helix-turn-helix transcriptional regulator n=1 Tax=Nocardia sp. CA-120079 TaxID=3239974 RepID=UPI003D951470
MKLPAEQRLGLDLKRAEQELMAVKHEAVKPLTVPQYAALYALSENPGVSAAALARECMVTPQAMTVVLKNLQERGFVERTPHPWHRGVLETRLTPAGRKAFAKADAKAAAIERRVAAAFSAQEREQLRELLARFTDALQE